MKCPSTGQANPKAVPEVSQRPGETHHSLPFCPNDIFCDRFLLASYERFAMVSFPQRIKPMTESGMQPHILVVDDARDIREPLVRYLKESGYRASAADGAASARRAMRTAGIDLVILDIMMPGEDGLSLCRSIRENSGIPVIMLTARGEELDRIVGLEVGADDYVAK